MIQQPIQQSIQQPICDSASQCSGNDIERSWLGHGVAVSKAFVKSLIPMEDPCLSFNSRKAVEDLLRLATTTIVPASSILFMAKDMANAWSGSGLPGPDAKPELPQTSKETREEAQEKEPGSKDVPLQQSSTARYQVSQGTKGLLALGTLASSFQYANSKTIKINNAEDLGKIGRYSDYPPHGTYQQTADIVVNNHRPIGDVSWWGFTGKYDGQCHTISGLSDCFVKKLSGSISDLQFTHANIRKINSGSAGLVACVVAEDGIVTNIRAKDVHIFTWGYDADAGIVGGRVKGKVGNIMALNSTVETKGPFSDAGIGGGEVYPRAIVGYITAVNCNVTTLREGSSAAIGGGLVRDQFIGGLMRRDGGKVAYTTAVNCRVETKGQQSHAAIGGGLVRGGGLVNDGGKVEKTTAVNCYVTASGKRAYAGIGKGWGVGRATNTKVVDNPNDPLLCQKADLRVFTDHCSAIAEFRDALALSVCPLPKKIYDAETLGKIGRHPDYPPNGKYYQTADIVVNKGHKPIGNDTQPFTGKYDGQCHSISGLSDCFVDTLEGSISDLQFTRANITNSAKPTGLAACVVDDTGTVSNIRAKDVHIVNSGGDADAGIGGGLVYGTVANIMAVDSTVETKGPFSDVGIGGGEVKAGGTVGNTAAVNSNVTTEGESAYAGIGGGVG
ncbi:hypothetical protein [Endozoicomonas sp. ALB115]|uniref:hypothetical protein n=1 Tax=Endozoicomonas sp. ALB115 TaxID=3403074 RepID=UPI003BB6450B